MRSRASAFTDVNATTDLVQQHTAGRHVGVVRDEMVEAAAAAAAVAAAATATVVIATAAAVVDNATAADALFRRPHPPPPPPPPPPHRQQPTTDQTIDDGRIHHRPLQSLGTVMVLMVVTVVVLGTVGLLTCVLHHYNQQYDPAVVPCALSSRTVTHHRLSTSPPPPNRSTNNDNNNSDINNSNTATNTSSRRTAMLTMRSNNGLTREHDRQVRLHSVRTDLKLDMPPLIHLPDGEEYPYGSMAKLHLRNSEQEQEIYQKCIKGPPNRTIWPTAADCGKLSQPHRSSSASGLTSLSTFASEVDSVTRCNSVSSRCLPRTGFPPVDNIQSLSSLTMVPCLSHVDKQTLRQ